MKNFVKYRKLYIICSLLLIFIAWLYWDNNALDVNEYTLINQNLPEQFGGYTIVHISDLHNRSFGKNQEYLIEKIKAETPNIIVVTGDIIDRNRTNIEIAMELINGAVQIAPVYYVTGNHEIVCEEYEELYTRMKDAGVSILENESVELIKDGTSIILSGIKDPQEYRLPNAEEKNAVYNILAEMKSYEEKFNILLAHRPEYMGIYREFGYDLVFSGHTHGGQIRLPFIGAVFAPNQGFFPKYAAGMYIEGDTCEIISRGLGNSIIQFRFLNRPELVVCHLEKQ